MLQPNKSTFDEAERAKQYKNAGKSGDLRRRRIESSVELRKQRRNDEMMKRRNIQPESNESDGTLTDNEDVIMQTVGEKICSIEDVIAIITKSPTIEQLRVSFEFLRRLLSRSKNPPIEKVIESGLVVAMVQAIEHVQDEKVQFEAAWALTNILSGTSEQTLAVVNAGAIKPLLNLCNSTSLKLAEQGVWAIANIAGDSVNLRDLLIVNSVIPILTDLCAKLDSLDISFIRTLAWTFSNLCRHKAPQLSYEYLKQIAPSVSILVQHSDAAVQQDSSWALSYITDGPDECIELAKGSLQSILNLISLTPSKDNRCISPALRVLGNFTTGNDDLTQLVIDTGILNTIIPTLLSTATQEVIIKECCWLVSNILAGTTEQIQRIIDAQIMPSLFQVLDKGDHRSKAEAGWAVANLCHGGSANQKLEIVRTNGSMESICQCLNIKDNELVYNMLDTIHVLLSIVNDTNPENLERFKDHVEECGGLDRIEALQQSESEQIYKAAYKIIEEFYNEDESMEKGDAQQAADLTTNTTFNF